MRTHSCRPGLRDSQVLDFCKQGFMVLEGVVPDEINRRTVEFLDQYSSHEPTEILQEDWFVDNVILNDQAAGAIRCLLGQNFGLPIIMSNHRVNCPSPAQNWHRDGNSKHGPALNYLQVFYYPEDVRRTWADRTAARVPFSLLFVQTDGAYGGIRGSYSCRCAGGVDLFLNSLFNLAPAVPRPAERGCATCSSTTTGAQSLRTGTGSGSLTLTLRRQTISWRIRRFGSSSATVTMLPRCSSGCLGSRIRLRWREAKVGL